MPGGTKWWTAAAIALLVVVALGRLGWAWHLGATDPTAATTPDSPTYLQPAQAILDDGRFDTAPGSGTPAFIRTPGFPLLLAGIVGISYSDTWLLVALAGISVTVILATWAVGRLVLGPGAGLVAATVVALDPLQNAASGMVMTETLSSLTLLGIVAAAWFTFGRGGERPQWRALVLLGTALAVAMLVRPTTYYLAPVVVAAVVVRWRRIGARHVTAAVAAMLLPLVLLLGGWQLRNQAQTGSWRFSGIDAVNLLCYRGADVQSRAEGRDIGDVRVDLGCDRGGASWRPGTLPDESDGPAYDEMASRGIELHLDHPVQVAEMMGSAFVRVTFGPGSETVSDYLTFVPRGTPTTAALAGWNLALLAVALAGAWFALRDRAAPRTWWAFTAVLVAYVLVVSSGTEGYARFRTPIVPLVALLVAAAWAAWARRRDDAVPQEASPTP